VNPRGYFPEARTSVVSLAFKSTPCSTPAPPLTGTIFTATGPARSCRIRHVTHVGAIHVYSRVFFRHFGAQPPQWASRLWQRFQVLSDSHGLARHDGDVRGRHFIARLPQRDRVLAGRHRVTARHAEMRGGADILIVEFVL
jgi:hypothetical protein